MTRSTSSLLPPEFFRGIGSLWKITGVLGAVTLALLLTDHDGGSDEPVPGATPRSASTLHAGNLPCRPGTELRPLAVGDNGIVRLQVVAISAQFSPGGSGPRSVRAGGQMPDGAETDIDLDRLEPLQTGDRSVYRVTAGRNGVPVLLAVEQHGFKGNLTAGSCPMAESAS